MTSCSAYSRGLTGSYDSDLLTKLVNNYRSHRAIIEIPKQLFYDDELNERAGEFRWVWKLMFKAMRVQWLVRKGALSFCKACILNLCMFCEIIMHSCNRRFSIRNLNWILYWPSGGCPWNLGRLSLVPRQVRAIRMSGGELEPTR